MFARGADFSELRLQLVSNAHLCEIACNAASPVFWFRSKPMHAASTEQDQEPAKAAEKSSTTSVLPTTSALPTDLPDYGSPSTAAKPVASCSRAAAACSASNAAASSASCIRAVAKAASLFSTRSALAWPAFAS